jgi:hypothetical protein
VVEQCEFRPAKKAGGNPQCVAKFLKNDALTSVTGKNYCAKALSEDECKKQSFVISLPTKCQLNTSRDGCELKFTQETVKCNGEVTENGDGVDGLEVDSRACAKCADEGRCGAANCTLTPYIAKNGCKPDKSAKKTESCKWLGGPAPVASAAPEVPVSTTPAIASAGAPDFTPPAIASEEAPVFTPLASASAVAPVFTPLASASAVAPVFTPPASAPAVAY